MTMELQEASPGQEEASRFDTERVHPAGLSSVEDALVPLVDPKDSAPTVLGVDEDVAPLEPAVAVEVVDVAAVAQDAEAAEHERHVKAGRKAARTRAKRASQ